MDIFSFLHEGRIAYQRFDHPPVYTVADVHRLTPDLPGSPTKNLFLHDGRGRRHFLVVVQDLKRTDLKQLARCLEVPRLTFASADRLRRILGVAPGAVSLLAVVNDLQKRVEVVIDAPLWSDCALQFHPLVNTSTLVIARPDLQRLLQRTGHAPRVIDVPAFGQKGA